MKEITFQAAIREAIREEMLRDENVYLIGEDVGVYGGAFGVSKGLIEEFGEDRIIDTPVSEAAIIGAATGSAVTGMRPIAEIMFMDFTTIAMDQIVNQTAKLKYMFGGKAKVPLVIRTAAGAGTGAAAQHSQSLESWLMHAPGLKLVVPSTPYDAKGLLKSAIREDNPIYFMEHKLLYKTKGPVPDEDYTVPIGVADVKRSGKDITIVATSYMVVKSLEAADILSKDGIEVEVIDPRTLVPLDEETIINSVKKTGKLLIIHEACKRAGIGAEISAIIAEKAFDYLDSPIMRLCGLDIPIPYNKTLEANAIPQVEGIVKKVKEML